MDAPSDAFLWVKALHIIAVVCWFAALFYLPRLYVYHAMSDDATSHQRFEVMERKLYRGIMAIYDCHINYCSLSRRLG